MYQDIILSCLVSWLLRPQLIGPFLEYNFWTPPPMNFVNGPYFQQNYYLIFNKFRVRLGQALRPYGQLYPCTNLIGGGGSKNRILRIYPEIVL